MTYPKKGILVNQLTKENTLFFWFHDTRLCRIGCLLTLLLVSTQWNRCAATEQGETAKAKFPNIVLLISDDAGWADFGFQGSQEIPTPHLDRLASLGVRFSNAYAGSVCGPSRAAMVTGKYNSRLGYETNIADDNHIIATAPLIGLSPDEVTMFDYLKTRGYTTGYIGKWHLGMQADNVQNGILFHQGNQPVRQGIDEFSGLLGGSRSYWGGEGKAAGLLRHQSLNSDGTIRDIVAEQDIRGQYVTDVLGNWSIDFVQRHAHAANPFFLVASFTAPHTPMHAKDEDLAAIDATGKGLKGERRVYAAMTLALDREIGRIVESLRDPNHDGDQSDSISDDTLVIFVNDNGGDCCDRSPNYSSNGILRGGKGTSWEGGFRIPMIVAGSGVDEAAKGTRFDLPVHLIDVLPTVLAASGIDQLPSELDGVNLLPYINHQIVVPPHEHLYLRRGMGGQVAVRMGKWKLTHRDVIGFQLFDLSENPSEKGESDASAMHPDVVSLLKRIMTDYDVQMQRPAWNVPNRSHRFRFRHTEQPVSKWSDGDVWYDLQYNSGSVTLTPWDGVADTGLVFWSRTIGDYQSVNDMTRICGLPFIINYLEILPRDQVILSDTKTTIAGLPVLMTRAFDGEMASLRLDSYSPPQHHVKFDFQLPVQLYSDLNIQGNGNDEFRFSGGFEEINPRLQITKMGQSTIILAAPSHLTGQIEILAGAIQVEHADALGQAQVIVRPSGKLVSTVPLDAETRSRIHGTGTIKIVD